MRRVSQVSRIRSRSILYHNPEGAMKILGLLLNFKGGGGGGHGDFIRNYVHGYIR